MFAKLALIRAIASSKELVIVSKTVVSVFVLVPVVVGGTGGAADAVVVDAEVETAEVVDLDDAFLLAVFFVEVDFLLEVDFLVALAFLLAVFLLAVFFVALAFLLATFFVVVFAGAIVTVAVSSTVEELEAEVDFLEVLDLADFFTIFLYITLSVFL
tara:strand:+ start:1366 stop:1836 length:471 start_codon:yes stop_codon:yes gene_type:complete